MEDDRLSQQELALNRAIIESIPGVFYTLNENGQFVRWNAYQRDIIMGMTDEQIAGKSGLSTIHPDDQELIKAKITDVLVNGKEAIAEARLLLHGGPEFKWFLLTGRQMVVDGKPFLVGVGVDITDRKQIEVTLNEKLKEVERLNQLMIGREIKMAELKGENKELKKKD